MTTAFYPIQNGTTAFSDGYFAIPGNFTGMFNSGFQFVVIDSGTGSPPLSLATTFTVQSSTFDGTNTRITPTTSIPQGSGSPVVPVTYISLLGGSYNLQHADPGNGSIIVPPGGVESSSTSLSFPGRATFNYGEVIGTDLLHLLENFASPTAPSAPIEGQLWYDTSTPANQILKVYDGTTFIPVGGAGSEFWRDPATIVDATQPDVATAEIAVNDGSLGASQGVTLQEGDRILFINPFFDNPLGSPIGSPIPPPSNAANIYTIVGTPGGSPGATLVEDNNRFPPEPFRGDVVYIITGNEPGSLYSFTENDIWEKLTTGGGGLAISYESQVATGAATFNLSTIKYTPTPDGSRLMVYVNGVKQTAPGSAAFAYTEVDPTTITFEPASIPTAGKIVEFYSLSTTTEQATVVREVRTDVTIGGSPVSGTITFNTITYVPGTEALLVYLNGQKVVRGVDYTELNPTQITWIGTPLVSGIDRLEFYSYAPIVGGSSLGDLDDVSGTASFGSPGPQIGDVLKWNGTEWIPAAEGTFSGVNTFELIAVGGETFVDVSPVVTQAKTGGKAFQQVFINGVLLREGASGSYVVTGPSQITFNAPFTPLSPGDEVIVYEL